MNNKPEEITKHTSLFAAAMAAPTKFTITYEYGGRVNALEARLLTPDEREELLQYDADSVQPPRFGPRRPDQPPLKEGEEFDYDDPEYRAKREHLSRMNYAYQVDKCIGLDLPQPARVMGAEPRVWTLEEKKMWFFGGKVEGLPQNPLPITAAIAIARQVNAINFPSVVTKADFI